VQRKTFGPKRDEGAEKQTRSHNQHFHDQYCSPNITLVIKSRMMRLARHVEPTRERRCVNRVLVEKPEGKRPLGRPRRRWEDNITLSFKERRVLY